MGKGNPNYPDVLLNFFPRVETSFGHESWDSGSIFRGGIDGRRGEKRKTENRFNFSVHRISQVFPLSSNSEFGQRYFLRLLLRLPFFPRKKLATALSIFGLENIGKMGSDLIPRKVRSRS